LGRRIFIVAQQAGNDLAHRMAPLTAKACKEPAIGLMVG
jgi:hypothetical protein